ncbi:MAG: prepilin-type N-terminal cleavage/methylation domain-containing protein [Candidatus Eremiobacteraeota bacterium]|nr:prepilin-type N-terminal cleavage/methylation domain-containing protein [Candidatus Eremiobacteraeota bacterium]
MKSQRGFTLIEVLIAIALFVGLGFATLEIFHGLLGAAAASATSEGGALTLEQQADELRSDAATAFAVFVPVRDVLRKPNAPGTPHEVDFYTKTDTGATTYWAYYYDAAARTLQRFDYDTTGARGIADRATGAIDTAGRYPVLPGVTSFDVRTLEANELLGANNVYASAMAPLFTASTPKPLPVGFDDGGPPRTDLYGGNTTVQVRIGTTHATRTIHLTTAALPSGFTVHAYPQIRAVVYRVDQTHRFWFGLAGKSHVFVNARLDISYDNWQTQPPQNWCDFNLYGYPGGLTGGPAENYHPEWFTESTAGIVYDVTHGKTPGTVCPTAPPLDASPGVSTAFTPPPDINDTPPPCFYRGQCWPTDAPPDWSPSPAPALTPPPAWCANHAESTLCGGTGPVQPPPAQSPAPLPPQFSGTPPVTPRRPGR